jgi:beta-phosphoglucomutase
MNQRSYVLDTIVEPNSVFLFDMDGTLINTDRSNFLSYKKALLDVKGSDFNLKFDLKNRLTRTRLTDLIPSIDKNELVKIIEQKEKYYKDYLNETTKIKVVYEILIKYSFTHNTVLVTNCRKKRALITLEHHGLTNKFTWIFFRNFNESGAKINKFENAISVLSLNPAKVITFENEETEVFDAIQAGILPDNIFRLTN